MKILKNGRNFEQECTKCHSLILIQEYDTVYFGKTVDNDYFFSFYCPVCDKENIVNDDNVKILVKMDLNKHIYSFDHPSIREKSLVRVPDRGKRRKSY